MQATDNLKKPVRLGALSMAKVTRALLDGPCSAADLQIASGLNIKTLYEYLRALRKESVVHICAWEKDATGRESLRIFQLGTGKDKLRQKKTKAQVSRDCRKRKQDAKLSRFFTYNSVPAMDKQQAIQPIGIQPGLYHAPASTRISLHNL